MTRLEIALTRLSRLTFEEATLLWNEGFTGYYTEMNRTLAQQLDNWSAVGVRPELSAVAKIGGKPVGFVLTAVRSIEEGRLTAWNAGTGVAPPYRGIGVGKALMDETVRIYREVGVHTAYLEAIISNSPAVALYRGCGFQIRDRLICYECKQPSDGPLFLRGEHAGPYRTICVTPREAGRLPFYAHNAAWCSQWPNIGHGEAMLALDGYGNVAGYALFNRAYAANDKLTEIRLLQAETDPGRTDRDEAARFLIAELFADGGSALVGLTAENIPASNAHVNRQLLEAGFTPFLEQFLMVRQA